MVCSLITLRRTGEMEPPVAEDSVGCHQESKLTTEKDPFNFFIKVNCIEIPVHRNVVMAKSDYFNAMLSHDTLENQAGIVTMKEVNGQCVKKFIDFIYTGKLSASTENISDLLHTAHLLQIQGLCDAIAESLQKILRPESFFDVVEAAEHYQCAELDTVCNKFLSENLGDILLFNGFGDVDGGNLSSLLDDRKCSAGLKLKKALCWVKQDAQTRHRFVASFLEFFGIRNVPPTYLRYLVENEPIIHGSTLIMRMIAIALVSRERTSTWDSESDKDDLQSGDDAHWQGGEGDIIKRRKVERVENIKQSLVDSPLSVDNFFEIKALASKRLDDNLEAKCTKFAIDNFYKISQSESFLDLEAEFVFSALKSLQAASQTDETKDWWTDWGSLTVAQKQACHRDAIKLNAVVRWTDRDLQARQVWFEKMFKILNIQNIPLRHFRDLLQTKAYIHESRDSLKHIILTIMDAAGVSAEDIAEETRKNALAILDSETYSLVCYEPAKSRWSRKHFLCQDFWDYGTSAIAVQNVIYILSVRSSFYRLNFSSITDFWEEESVMVDFLPEVAATNSGNLYVLGEADERRPINTVIKRHNPASNDWTLVTEMDHCIFKTTFVATNGFLFCIGGYLDEYKEGQQEPPVGRVDMFDLSTSTWSEVAPMMEGRARARAGSMVFNDKIYLFGGTVERSDASCDVRCYDIFNNTWTSIVPMNHTRMWPCPSLVEGKIYVTRGLPVFCDDPCSTDDNAIEWLDFENNKWVNLKVNFSRRLECCAAVAVSF